MISSQHFEENHAFLWFCMLSYANFKASFLFILKQGNGCNPGHCVLEPAKKEIIIDMYNLG